MESPLKRARDEDDEITIVQHAIVLSRGKDETTEETIARKLKENLQYYTTNYGKLTEEEMEDIMPRYPLGKPVEEDVNNDEKPKKKRNVCWRTLTRDVIRYEETVEIEPNHNVLYVNAVRGDFHYKYVGVNSASPLCFSGSITISGGTLVSLFIKIIAALLRIIEERQKELKLYIFVSKAEQVALQMKRIPGTFSLAIHLNRELRWLQNSDLSNLIITNIAPRVLPEKGFPNHEIVKPAHIRQYFAKDPNCEDCANCDICFNKNVTMAEKLGRNKFSCIDRSFKIWTCEKCLKCKICQKPVKAFYLNHARC